MSMHFDPDSDYANVRLRRNDDGRIILSGERVLAKAGDKVRFLDRGGYDYECERARKYLRKDDIATVRSVSVGLNSSRYAFDGIPSVWNTVMFELVQP